MDQSSDLFFQQTRELFSENLSHPNRTGFIPENDNELRLHIAWIYDELSINNKDEGDRDWCHNANDLLRTYHNEVMRRANLASSGNSSSSQTIIMCLFHLIIFNLEEVLLYLPADHRKAHEQVIVDLSSHKSCSLKCVGSGKYFDIVREVAREAWKIREDGKAGYLLHRSLPIEQRPYWAVAILKCAGNKLNVPSEVRRVIEVASNADRWKEGYNAFHEVRYLTIQQRKIEYVDPLFNAFLRLAENTAKVTFNSAGGKFDKHCGDLIPPLLRVLLDAHPGTEYMKKAEATLFSMHSSK